MNWEFAKDRFGTFCAELDIPEANRFAADSDTAFSEQIFNISMAEVESIVKRDGVADDVGREPVSFVCIHAGNLY